MAVSYAKYRHGNVLMVDYTPGGDGNAGDVLVVGDGLVIAHNDYKNGVKAAMGGGGGVYEMPKASGGSTAIADRKKVYWDNTNKVITATASTHKLIGLTVGASVDGDTKQLVHHVGIGT